jgi:hypothetical protein
MANCQNCNIEINGTDIKNITIELVKGYPKTVISCSDCETKIEEKTL